MNFTWVTIRSGAQRNSYHGAKYVSNKSYYSRFLEFLEKKVGKIEIEIGRFDGKFRAQDTRLEICAQKRFFKMNHHHIH